jgi:adenosine deaminase
VRDDPTPTAGAATHPGRDSPVPDLEALADFARSLPKAELHIHLEGALEAELLFELAARNDVALPWRSIDALRGAYRFENLQSFLDLFLEGCRVLVHERDFYDLTRAYLARAHADGVVHAEAFLGTQSFVERGVPMGAILGGTLRAIDDARDQDGITAGLLVSAQRHRTEADAFSQLDGVLPWADRIAGFGLGGAEVDNPPAKFAGYFDELHRLGFRTCAHAGEEGPAAYVRDTVELLGVDRVDHGVNVVHDAALVRALAAQAIPFTVCPLSNVKLQVVPSLAAHPLPAMLAAGLNVSINSDDPAYFGGYALDNYTACAHTFELGRDVLADLAESSIRAAFITEEAKQPFLDRIAQLRAS